MESDNAAAVAPPAEAPQQADAASPHEQAAANKPRRLPPHAVVVLNDNDHTFQYVIDVFRKVLGYRQEKCQLLAVQIHQQGRGIVWSGPKEVAELKRDQILSAGPDFYAARKVEGPLGVFIEPLPG
jgi:ATP-dependent Clp protease adaptor protein ClpS